MRVFSFISDRKGLIPVEVELTLLPGLPSIQFVGLPDQHLKESVLRIKTAIKTAGFEYPKAQQIVVNLRPSHLRKTSRGLELAVAAAYLWETKQVKAPELDENFFVYGELNLSGEVFEPEDLPQAFAKSPRVVLTGKGREKNDKNYPRQRIQDLQSLHLPKTLSMQVDEKENFVRPSLPRELAFSPEQARWLKILAVGRHHALLTGAAGSGKTTFAKALSQILPAPPTAYWRKIRFERSEDLRFYPFIKPHHNIPLASMIGGGSIPQAGEISRAHGGILFMDEFLEFKPQVLEALREPLEEKLIRISRGAVVETYPADFQLIGASNLCPCGDLVPVKDRSKSPLKLCRYSAKKCQSYRERGSGPLLDRFEIALFFDRTGAKNVPLERILAEIEELSVRPPSRPPQPVFHPDLSGMKLSDRRRIAVEKVAQTLAKIDGLKSPGPIQYDEAMDLSLLSFERIRAWDFA